MRYDANSGVAVLSQSDETEDLVADDSDPAAYVQPPSPVWPTMSPPGSAEKIRVMEWRLAHGFSAFHPGDLQIEPHGFARMPPARLGNGCDQRGVDITTNEPLSDDYDDAD